jgi:hypothetical protein
MMIYSTRELLPDAPGVVLSLLSRLSSGFFSAQHIDNHQYIQILRHLVE